jgi:hypothetical protein
LHLLVECWQLSLSYQAGGISFSTYAGNTLRRRVVDWQRATVGRTRWTSATVVSTSGLGLSCSSSTSTAPTEIDFDQLSPRGWAILQADCDPDRERLLGDGDRARARDYALLGLEPPRRAA